MTGKNIPPELISAKEAIEICLRAGTIDSIEKALPIFEGYKKEFSKECNGSETAFITACALGTVYDAGRIQGIREERKAKRDKF